jgi:hypothetical protein
MTHIHLCQECGTELNPGFYRCSKCGFDNSKYFSDFDLEIKRAEFRNNVREKWEKAISADKTNAKKEGFERLYDYYAEEYQKNPVMSNPGFLTILGFKPKPLPFNPARVRYGSNPEEMFSRTEKPSDTYFDWDNTGLGDIEHWMDFDNEKESWDDFLFLLNSNKALKWMHYKLE